MLLTAVEGFLPHLNNGLISAPPFKIAPLLSPSKPVKALPHVLWGLRGGIIYVRYGKIIQEKENIIPEQKPLAQTVKNIFKKILILF